MPPESDFDVLVLFVHLVLVTYCKLLLARVFVFLRGEAVIAGVDSAAEILRKECIAQSCLRNID